MKYALLIYDVPGSLDALPDGEREAVMGEYFAITNTPGIVGGEQLHPVETATTVRVQDGEALTTDGPFADTKSSSAGTTCSRPTTSTPPSRSRPGFRRPAWAARSRSARSWSGRADRAGLPGRMGAGPRLPGGLPRRLRPRRGSRPRSVRDRRRALGA